MDFDDLNNSLELTQIAAKTVDVKITNQQELYISVLAIYKLGRLRTSHERNLPHQCTNWRIGYLLRLDLLATKAKLPIKQIATKAASAEAKQFLSALLTTGKTWKNHWFGDHKARNQCQRHPETRNPSICTWHHHGYRALWRFEPLSSSGSLSPWLVSRLQGPVNQGCGYVWVTTRV